VKRRTIPLRLALLLLLALSLPFVSCAKQKKGAGKFAVPVSIARAEKKNVPLQLTVIGNVEAYSTVSVRAQVNGILMKVHFKEGDYVKKGDLLFTIDPRPYQEAYQKAKADWESYRDLVKEAKANYQKAVAAENQERANLNRAKAQEKQARANLEKDQSQAKLAAGEAKRYKYLLDKGFATQEQNDTYQTQLESSNATVRADEQAIESARAAVIAEKATIENVHAGVIQAAASIETAGDHMRSAEAQMKSAALDLGFCTIHSPLDGKTGSLLIHEGNLIKAQDTLSMVVINRINPIYIDYAVPERYLEDIKRYNAIKRLTVHAMLLDKNVPPETGLVSFIDNSIETTTGTIKLKATFANEKRYLWPGQFVNVAMTLTTIENAVIIPTQAILEGQKGSYVYVVKQDKTAESRPIKTGIVYKENTVIPEGLKEGDEVITAGQLSVTEGTQIEIREPQGGAPAREGKGP
jgi:membrane fusion protein, multidrug efflux system